MTRGIQIQTQTESREATLLALQSRLAALGLAEAVDLKLEPGSGRFTLQLTPQAFAALTPEYDTIGLAARSSVPFLEPEDALAWEIWVAWLSSPVTMSFDSWEDLQSAKRMRKHLCHDGRLTSMNFRTEDASRPEAYWRYEENSGYILQPDADLVEALVMATQPEVSGQTYAFSCYRATEYVLLLAIAQEAKSHNPVLYEQLLKQWRQKAISSRQFHASFLHEIGDPDSPLPMTWYVPGDRVWFKNPHPLSSDATGYEGSWVIYLGQGLFCNFWNHRQPYTLDRKCVELYHWRHGYQVNSDGIAQMDEDKVAALTQQTLSDPDRTQSVLCAMKRYRDPMGVYADGGCIDSTRELPRKVLPWNCEVVLPLAH